MKSAITSKITLLIPLLLIVAVVVMLLEREKQAEEVAPLLPPDMRLIALDVRAPHQRNFNLPALSGDTMQLSELAGQVVVLNFFATLCSSCQKEMASLEALYQGYKDQGVIVLGIASDPDGKSVVEPFVEKFQLSFPIVLDPEQSAFKQYFVQRVPVTYFIDKQQRIAGMYPGDADWNSAKARALIEQLLQES